MPTGGTHLLPSGYHTATVTAPGFAKSTLTGVGISVERWRKYPSACRWWNDRRPTSCAAEIQETSALFHRQHRQRRITRLTTDATTPALTDSQVLRGNALSIGAAPRPDASGQRARSNLAGWRRRHRQFDQRGSAPRFRRRPQEFQIITNGYAPEYGRASGA
jgi:hypothetical protein